jgi:DNA invertase Pin-like site-specific DNA recombinase
MNVPQSASKITPEHLVRRAVVYLRQSSERQVEENKESQRLQYALADRARALGFNAVEVVDCDLGLSATVGAPERDGFKRLIASVALGEVGIILSREVARLSRTDKDWCQLLEACQYFGTLLGDSEQIYDLGLLDDQLILGIKGTMSVVELKVLKLRLIEGMQEKARRGELVRLLPPGYVLDGDGRVAKDPDERVREAIPLIFRKFQETWSIRQTFLWFHNEGIELPVNKSGPGGMRVVWQLPTYAFVSNVLHNPFYAGAYVWGQRPVEMRLVEGRLLRRTGRLRGPEECKVFIRDHHEGYIDWARYQENLRRMRQNNLKVEGDEAVAVVRSGQGILAGVLRCGRCGRKLHVRYWGKRGTAPRYLCAGDFSSGGRYCLSFGGAGVDHRFGEELLRVISPVGVRASLRAIEWLASEGDDARAALHCQVKQLEYEAGRAREQYDEVDPRNRLVAAELERRWNSKLEELEEARAKLSRLGAGAHQLSDAEEAAIIELGENFEKVWTSERCAVELKKKIIRTVIEEVTVDLDDESQTLGFTMYWKGGTHTRFEMPKPPSGVGRATHLEDLEVIRRMAGRYGDREIARVLVKLGRRTATGKRWNEIRVRTVRHRYGISGREKNLEDPEVLTKHEAAKHCGVSITTIQRLVETGALRKEQVAPWAPWEIRREDLESEQVREILERLRRTGKLGLGGDDSGIQLTLFEEKEAHDDAR